MVRETSVKNMIFFQGLGKVKEFYINFRELLNPNAKSVKSQGI